MESQVRANISAVSWLGGKLKEKEDFCFLSDFFEGISESWHISEAR